MEVLSPFEALDDGDWIGPRISFSQDFQFSGRCSPKMQFKDSPEEEFSFIFGNSANVDLHADDSMLSADELFVNGKVRPLLTDAKIHEGVASLDEKRMHFGRSIKENPRCFSMTIESSRGGAQGGRGYMSLHNSRCSSPSRTMSMPHTTPTSPKSSSSTSRVPSSSGLSGRMALLASSPLTSPGMSSSSISRPSSSVASSSSMTSSKYSNKLKDFFKLKKGNLNKDAMLPSIAVSSTSAQISRESPYASGSSSCRHPSRSFWPFSRSNSAGESKSTPTVSPPPRRSNSAGEGKTTSSSLLPTVSGPPSKQPVQDAYKSSSDVAVRNEQIKGLPSSAGATSSSNAMPKKGLPPLPNFNPKKTNSFFVPAHCVADSVELSSQSTPLQACNLSQRNLESTSSMRISEAEPPHLSPGNSPGCVRETFMLPDERSLGADTQHPTDAIQRARKARMPATASPGRPMRRGAHGTPARNFARGSPGRRGAWNSPGRGSGGRVTIRNLDRGSISSKGHVRPKDMLSRDGAPVRISPVLNVAVPSLRGTKTSSKPKMFGLVNLFSKKDRVASSRTNAVLPPLES